MKILVLIILLSTQSHQAYGTHVKSQCKKLMTFFTPILNGDGEISCDVDKLTIVKSSGEVINVLHNEAELNSFDPEELLPRNEDDIQSNNDALKALHIENDDLPFTGGRKMLMRSKISCETATEMWKNMNSKIVCDKYGSRTFDGTCDHWKNKGLAAAQRPFKRLLQPDYCDDHSLPRCTNSGEALPSARKVSSSIQIKPKQLSSAFSAFFMQWGQYISHDISHTPTTNTKCSCFRNVSSSSECDHIKLNKCEKFSKGRSCLSINRSMKTFPLQCDGEAYREQINQVTP